jgi:hypothetical protein
MSQSLARPERNGEENDNAEYAEEHREFTAIRRGAQELSRKLGQVFGERPADFAGEHFGE